MFNLCPFVREKEWVGQVREIEKEKRREREREGGREEEGEKTNPPTIYAWPLTCARQ